MSYLPLGDGRKHPHVENIELTATNDGQSRYNDYRAPPGLPPDGGTKYSNYNASFAPDKPAVNDWPVNSQQVAALTPLRGSILVFDILLASTPLLFIGMAFSHNATHLFTNICSPGPHSRPTKR